MFIFLLTRVHSCIRVLKRLFLVALMMTYRWCMSRYVWICIRLLDAVPLVLVSSLAVMPRRGNNTHFFQRFGRGYVTKTLMNTNFMWLRDIPKQKAKGMCKAVCLHAKFNEEWRVHENVTGQTGCDVMAVNLEHPARPFPCDSVSTEVRMLLVFLGTLLETGAFWPPSGEGQTSLPTFSSFREKAQGEGPPRFAVFPDAKMSYVLVVLNPIITL